MPNTKSKGEVVTKIPDCPVCMSNMNIPIYQCKSGHSICNNCTKRLQPAICPLCRQDITQTRNLMLEEIISMMKVSCPNKSLGCVFVVQNNDLNKHKTECIYRNIDCPIGVTFGKCSWNGLLVNITQHFNERHSDVFNPKEDMELKVNLNEDERYIYLISKQKQNFLLTIKIDLLQKMAFFAIQCYGSQHSAEKNSYEIKIYSKQDDNKIIIFNEVCLNDFLKADGIFRSGKCAMIPLTALKHFISNNKLSFKFEIKNAVTQPFKGKPNPNTNQGPPKKGGKVK